MEIEKSCKYSFKNIKIGIYLGDNDMKNINIKKAFSSYLDLLFSFIYLKKLTIYFIKCKLV